MRLAHVLLAASLILPAPALLAQTSGDGYRFGVPDARFTLHAGYAHAFAQSDVFDEAIRFLTLERSSFSAPDIGGDFSFTVAPRLDVSLTADYSAAVRESEDRGYLDNNNLPIQQTTSFRRAPFMANVTLYLTPRGRSIGKLAWIPARVVPWVGAGGGATWYRFMQEGDFVNYQTLNVFTAVLSSSGWASTAQASAGVDFTLTPNLALTLDARRYWASAKPSDDYRTYDKIDLSGVTGALGLTLRL
ncbi:MAG TPA: hypothetical protein VFN38_14825 [Gemmatimonadaceae bacterium]|nr:hypothetical protein [Gemmatimonadaceae bacterium]